MERGILTKYNASAGSGKTYKLTAIYLARILGSGNAYRRILAVTFTHKAASDMKRKILSELSALALGERTGMVSYLESTTGKTFESLAAEARKVLESILYDYSLFSVGTIDSFFQKVIRAFTREINLQQGYTIELDHSLILDEAVERMLENSRVDEPLRNWLTEYSDDRLDEGKSWNLKTDLLIQAEQVFNEKFRLLPAEDRELLMNRDFLNSYLAELRAVKFGFGNKIKEDALKCLELLSDCGVSDDMFLRGTSGGVPSFLRKLIKSSGNSWDEPGKTVLKVLEDPPQWTTKSKNLPRVDDAMSKGFDSMFTDLLNYYSSGYMKANTASAILENIYMLGILTDILFNIREITSNENKFLLSDAGELLFRITGNDQTPFIYEKVGTVFENFMIDEFQDTSHIQWNNFRPLISDSLAQGNDNLVVGDIKQSIYRWRNSDWSIFSSLLNKQIGEDRIKKESLDTNWRSKKNIISFNNSLFSVLPEVLDASEKFTTGSLTLKDVFFNSAQDCPPGREGGMVKITFLDGDEDKGFYTKALSELPSLLEMIQDKGYTGSDIGILVRRNREGADVLNTLLDYRKNAGDEKLSKYTYKAVSNESLLLSNSSSACFITGILHYIFDEKDELNRAIILRNWFNLNEETNRFGTEIIKISDKKYFESLLGEDAPPFLEELKEKTLFEAVESVISFFDLGKNPGNTPFLTALQDSVIEYSETRSADIPGFLKWWEVTGQNKSVTLSDDREAMRVMTIHKSKGLEFKIVVIPFINWSMGHAVPPMLWLSPSEPPFNKLGLVPVKYRSNLTVTDFSDEYLLERYSAAVDNLNLLYVAFTRATDGLFGFCPGKSRKQTIADFIRQAISSQVAVAENKPYINFNGVFDEESNSFSYGQLARDDLNTDYQGGSVKAGNYPVHDYADRLKLRFHGENWLIKKDDKRSGMINYGKLMHEVFESVLVLEDIPAAVNKLVSEGKLQASEKELLIEKLKVSASDPEVSDWFSPGKKILNEPTILIPGGESRRPDRVILENDSVSIVDFKFGLEKAEHANQVKGYKSILSRMGYTKIKGYLWYVDAGKIINV
ncbi:MAG: UvrD-helicase domain-containing protein [Bacteroidales bacterium]